MKTYHNGVASCDLDKELGEKLKSVSWSNNMVARRIDDNLSNIETQLISRIHYCDAYALQLAKSTNVARLAILLVFMQYLFDKGIKDNLLLCKSLELRSTGNDIFKCH